MSKSSVESLLSQAKANTHLEDFGGQDFLVGLRVLVESVNESSLGSDVEEGLYANIVNLLERRLQIIEQRKIRPEIVNEKIEAPLIVVGLPRTGTSALVDLLAQDPAARVIQQWETVHLFPVPDRLNWSNDSRIADFELQLQKQAESSEFVKLGLHSYGARLPEECHALLRMDFKSPDFAAPVHLQRYSDWLRFSNYRYGYEFHRQILQQLQHYGAAGRWTLKSPFHAFDLAGLIAEYPDAMLVQTHRDPLQFMPSVCGIYSTIRGERDGHPRRIETGKELCDLYGTGMQRVLSARRDPNMDARIFDISHRKMVKDPLGTLRSVYTHFDLPFTKEVETCARNWVDAPTQHMSSKKFTLAEFGLDAEKVEAAFAGYRERFGDYI